MSPRNNRASVSKTFYVTLYSLLLIVVAISPSLPHCQGMDSDIVVHQGGCHCGCIRWRAQAPASVVAWNCNCSNCSMRGNTHFIVPSQKFELLGDSEDFITTYSFGTHTAKHMFCKVCGITSFYTPRSNPDGIAVTFRCVDPGTLTNVEIKEYDGTNWEASFRQTDIASFSKVEQV